MKRLNKVLLSTATALFALGLILAVAGWAMGGQTTMEVDVWGHKATIGVTGFHRENSDRNLRSGSSVQEDLTAFDKLDVDISLGEVEVVSSDHFGVDLSWRGKNYELHYTNEDGILKVWSTSIPNIGINLGQNYDGKATIYIPEGTQMKDITIYTALGDMDLKDFHTDSLDISASLGSVSIANAVVNSGTLELDLGDLEVGDISADSLDIILSMGRLQAYNVTTTKELKIENSMGDIDVQGSLGGRVEVSASMGDVTISSDLSDYGYDLSTGMGTIRLNGDKQDDEVKRNGGTNFITADNAMGNIDVNFN